MTTEPHPIRHRLTRIGTGALVAIVLIAIAFGVYVNMVSPGERGEALRVWNDASIAVTDTDHSIVLSPTSGAGGTGLVFIPGAKVDPYAYMFKLSSIVEAGVTVVITKPTLNLAFFDARPLSTFEQDVPDVSRWFVGGHSLGGVKACMLADAPDVAGLVLFGSYCANDLTDSGLPVLSIAGSEDHLSTPQKITSAASLLPADTTFVEIEGANHAAFGDYGKQSGDGVATITADDARDAITDALEPFLGLAPTLG